MEGKTALRAEIEAQKRRFAAAHDGGDLAGLAGFYSAEARLLPPDAEV
jgi:hypothetical protein